MRWPWQRKPHLSPRGLQAKTTYFIDGPFAGQTRPFEACRALIAYPILTREGRIIDGPTYMWDTLYLNAAVAYMRVVA